MPDKKKIKLFEETPIPKAVATLAIPTILSSLVMVIYNMADTYFVGMLNDPIQTAGVTLAAPVLLSFNAINNLFGVGTSSTMSRALGRYDYETVKKSSAFGFWCSVLCALVFSLCFTLFKRPMLNLLGCDSKTMGVTSQYLMWTTTLGALPAILNVVMAHLVRSEGYALHASIGTMSGCLLNIILDPLFILPSFLGFGAAGAGLATFISNCVACLYFFVLIYKRRGKTNVCLNPMTARRIDKKTLTSIFSVGIPAAVQNLLNVTSMTVMNNFTSSYGESVVASMGIAQKANQIPLFIAMGGSQGIMPLISYTYAGKKTKRMKDTIKFSFIFAFCFLIVFSVVYFFGSELIIGLFMKNAEVIKQGSIFLHGMCLGIPFLAIDFFSVAVFQACGKGQYALVFAILRKVALEIPILCLLNAVVGVNGLGYAQFFTELILSTLAMTMLLRFLRRIEE